VTSETSGILHAAFTAHLSVRQHLLVTDVFVHSQWCLVSQLSKMQYSDSPGGPRASDLVERHHLHTEAHTQCQLRLSSVCAA